MLNNQNHIYGLIAQNRDNSLTVGATSDNIPEGVSNLYFTSSRARNVLSGTSPILYNSSTGIFSIQKADSTHNGYLSSSDWNTFNNKANSFTGFTGSKTIVTSVNFTTQTVVTETLNFVNGVLQ